MSATTDLDGVGAETGPRIRSAGKRSGASRRAWLRLTLMGILPLAAVLGGGYWYLTTGRFMSTDDAYVQADAVSISSDVAGRVVEVDVHNNEKVKQGQLLFKLDDRPYKIAVERAEAQLAAEKLQIDGLRATYRQKQADLKQAQDTLGYQQREADRQQQLLNDHIVSQSAFDQIHNRVDSARQAVAAAQQANANVLATLGGNPNVDTDQHPLVQQAQAALDQAKLNLSYTVVRAPEDGIVTNVDKLPVGTYLNTATPAFSLFATDNPWVEANFKETDLTHMKPGDEATVSVDAYPGKIFKAHVASLSPGTGNQFSVLPPQNATGNWVKVVQRLPVRLAVDNPDPDMPLRAGMSVTADVDTKYVRPMLTSVDSLFGVKPAAAHPGA
jgi:membrane fusion protein (multidrug efflux system)